METFEVPSTPQSKRVDLADHHDTPPAFKVAKRRLRIVGIEELPTPSRSKEISEISPAASSKCRKRWPAALLKTIPHKKRERRRWSCELLKSPTRKERCLICLEDDLRCAHIAPHGKQQRRCGPWPVCIPCARRLCQKAKGQLVCPICRIRLGPLRRGLQEGSDVFKWEDCANV
mmetsp:Transcript_83443/g.131823  ORF Transcript_83443/g.131823 Transcript_83443/m.131823 type:complete len:174 (-) Transcript_83443:120-641(-)